MGGGTKGRRRATEGFRHAVARQLFERLYDALPLPAFSWRLRDGEFYLECLNPAADALTRGEGAQFVGKSLPAIYPDRPDLVLKVRQCHDSGETMRFETPYRARGTGEDRFCAFTFVPAPPADVLLLADDITEQRRSEVDLLRSEQRYRAYVDSAPLGIFVADDGGRYVDVNPAACRMTGYSREELLQLKVYDLAAGEGQPDTFASLKQAGQAAFEKRLQRKDGTRFDALIHAVTMANGTRMALVTDISQRKQAEQALRESERRFREIAENIHEVFWTGAPDWSEVYYVSPAYEAVWGRPCGSLYDEPMAWFAAIHPDDRPAVRAAIDEWSADATSGPPFPPYRVVRPDGSVRWIAARSFPVRDQSGAVVRIVGIAEDITERRRAEQELQQSRVDLRNPLAATTDGIWSWDFATDTMSFSDRYYEMLGYAPGEFPAGFDSWQALLHPDDRERALDVARTYLERKPEIYNNEFRLRSRSGDYHWIRASARVVKRDAAGRALLLIGNHEDITERKGMEAQLAQADRLSAMGLLAAGVAHEINNPLSYVLYNIESLVEDLPALRTALGPRGECPPAPTDAERPSGAQPDDTAQPGSLPWIELEQRLRDALEGAHRIRDVARDLALFSRVDDDGSLSPLALSVVIDGALKLAHKEICYRAQLLKDYASNLPRVLGDAGRLSQVFLNLLINAAHAIEEGEVAQNEVRVTLWADGDQVCAEVRDSGAGIAAEDLDRIFDPFYSTKEAGVGTGLGLAISKAIIESHGGTITAESERDGGTRVTVRLPAAEGDHPVEQADAAEAAPDTVRGRVLIVDDEPGVRVAVARILREHDTVQAASGEEARQILQQDQAFDLVLCDMMMPGVSGMDLHQWLAAQHPRLARRLVFVTGGTFTPRAREYLSQVDNVTLEKPFDAATFRQTVSEAIRTRRSRC